MTFKDELRQLRLEKKLQEEALRKEAQKDLDIEEIIKVELEKVCRRQEEAEKKERVYMNIVEYCRNNAKKGKMYAEFCVSSDNNDNKHIFFLDDDSNVFTCTEEDLNYFAYKNKFYLQSKILYFQLWFEFGEHPFFNSGESLLKQELFELWKKSPVTNPNAMKNQALSLFCKKYAVENDSMKIEINTMHPLPDMGKTYIRWVDVYAFCIMHDMSWNGEKIDFCLDEDEAD